MLRISAAALSPDPEPQDILWAKRGLTGLTSRGEGGGEPRAAGGAAGPDRACALRALERQLVLGLLEVAECVPAGEAERGPVAERAPALLDQPIRRLSGSHAVQASR